MTIFTAEEAGMMTIDARERIAREVKRRQDAWDITPVMNQVTRAVKDAAASGSRWARVAISLEPYQFERLQGELEGAGYDVERINSKGKPFIRISWDIPNMEPSV